jgi:hypothetical protein
MILHRGEQGPTMRATWANSIGGAYDFKVFVGQPGAGAGAVWAFQEHFLPEPEGVQATLSYRDRTESVRRDTA